MTLSDEIKNEPAKEVEFPDLDASRGSLKAFGGNVGDEALRLRLANFIKQHPNLTTVELGRKNQMGVSRTLLDSYLAGKYFLAKDQGGMGVNPRNSQTESKIRAYLDKMEGSISTGGHSIGFMETVLWQQFQFLCNTAIKDNVIGVGYGSPGFGKSKSMLQYSGSNLKTRPIHILCSANITTGYFVHRLAREAGITPRGCIPQVEDDIADRLIKQKRLIFVDQANYLNPKSIGTICHLWERARVPIVLTGTYKLYELFNSLSDTEDIKGQFVSRIALFVNLMGISAGEVKSVVERTIGKHASSETVAEIFNTIARKTTVDGEVMEMASFRNLDFLMARLVTLIEKHTGEIERGETLVRDLVPEAANRLMLGY